MWRALEADVVVIGSGLAGLLVSLSISKQAKVTLITDGELGKGNSILAQGGIAVPIGTDDQVSFHIDDTLTTGHELSDPQAVETLILGANAAVNELIELGISFDRDQNGHLILGREGAHSRNRIIHSGGDATGKNVIDTLSQHVENSTNITVLEHTKAIDLLVQNNECEGIVVQDTNQDPYIIHASIVILASGGLGQLFPYSTNAPQMCGTGIGMAYLAGAKVRDMEFVQFHPTALCINRSPMPLISEAVRGEGAILVNDHGTSFMSDLHPLQDLAPRDIVSRAIFNEQNNGRQVYLDARSIPNFDQRFPTITALCGAEGIFPQRDLIPVSPAAHYLMGGIVTDLHGKTSIQRLYAIGEVASTGVHGANRLASNSLLEALVYTKRAAQVILEELPTIKVTRIHPIYRVKQLQVQKNEIQSLEELLSAVQKLMWQHVGIVRNEKGLRQAQQQMDDWIRALGKYPIPSTQLHLLTTAKLVIDGALWRQESRGAHYRSDYPKSSDQFIKHYIHGGSYESNLDTKSVTASAN